MRRSLFAIVLCLWASSIRADQRIWVDAEVNGQAARFIFDTGADRLILFRNGAERLKLKLTQAPSDSFGPSGTVGIGETESCDVRLLGNYLRMPLGVVEMPSFLDMQADGVLGWGAIQNNILAIDAISSRIEFAETIPKEAAGWTKLQLQKGSGFLSLEIPHEGSSTGLVLVDTGFTGGVAVPPAAWQGWKRAHPHAPASLDSYFMPGAGLVVKEETWAGSIEFGPLQLTAVPLIEANRAQVALGSSSYEASLGLAALKRLDFIVDGREGTAYVRLKTTPPLPYQHNRLGAVFVPPDARSDSLVAQLASDSPAQEAGICNGDILLKIGGLDVTKWRSDPAVSPLSHFWMQPAGTRLDLTLKRQSTTFKTTVMLRQILGPGQDTPARANQDS
jgi:hypothetical protein